MARSMPNAVRLLILSRLTLSYVGTKRASTFQKVDKAICDPVRLKQILDGKLFPLRAIGYFAVVAGMENRDATFVNSCP